jgi:hypothetical protein
MHFCVFFFVLEIRCAFQQLFSKKIVRKLLKIIFAKIIVHDFFFK